MSERRGKGHWAMLSRKAWRTVLKYCSGRRVGSACGERSKFGLPQVESRSPGRADGNEYAARGARRLEANVAERLRDWLDKSHRRPPSDRSNTITSIRRRQHVFLHKALLRASSQSPRALLLSATAPHRLLRGQLEANRITTRCTDTLLNPAGP